MAVNSLTHLSLHPITILELRGLSALAFPRLLKTRAIEIAQRIFSEEEFAGRPAARVTRCPNRGSGRRL